MFKKLAVILYFILYSTCFAESKIFNYWDGESYRENAQLQAIWAYKFFFKNYEFIGNENILDIGSGDGKITAAMARLTPRGRVIGIDNSDSMLEIAHKIYNKISNLNFIKEDATNLEYFENNKNSFDIITAFTVLHWITNQNIVLQGINIALKENGKFFIRVCAKNGDPIQDIADELIKSKKFVIAFKGFIDPMNRFDEKEYSELLIQAGFKNFAIDDARERDEVANRQSAIKQIKSWLPHYHFLKSKNLYLAEVFIETLMDQYLSEAQVKSNGKIILFSHFLEIRGEK